MNYFVTGIDTDSGKTLASAILCTALKADYWKPIQAGAPGDREEVHRLVGDSSIRFHHERYFLKTPASPHAAARIEGVEIKLDDFVVPVTTTDLVIEGAGGCLVPINDHEFVIDLASRFDCEVVLVADLYLGSINHTLLTVRELQRRRLSVKGIIFNGPANAESERIILHHSKMKCLLKITREAAISPAVVEKYAHELRINWYE